jgi:hypothetical protein
MRGKIPASGLPAETLFMLMNMGQIFPISDAPSARLMKLKALCLFRAGILTDEQRAVVSRQANEVLGDDRPPRSGHSTYNSQAA